MIYDGTNVAGLGKIEPYKVMVVPPSYEVLPLPLIYGVVVNIQKVSGSVYTFNAMNRYVS